MSKPDLPDFSNRHPPFVHQKNARRGSIPIAFVKRGRSLIKVKNPDKLSVCYFCKANVQVKSPGEKNICPSCRDLARTMCFY